MKAISFLEYYNTLDEENGATNMLCDLSSYYKKVFQPFSFEKAVELFEGFEINDRGLYLVSKDLLLETICDEMYYYISYSTFLNLEFNDSEVHSIGIIPKTIDEFIVLCNNLNIGLQWKIKNI
jgi:hypothetical protein